MIIIMFERYFINRNELCVIALTYIVTTAVALNLVFML